MPDKYRLLFLPLALCLSLMTQLSSADTSSIVSANADSDEVQIQQRLKKFSPQSLAIINREIDFQHFGGVIPAKVVDQLTESSKGPINDVMLNFLPLASYFALPVISNFYVGAVAQGESGALYLGANLEVAGVGLNNSIHAEQSATNNAFLHNEKGLVRIAITAAPCGHCRQFMNEINNGSDIEIIVLEREPTHLKELLPESFGPVDLGSTTPLFVVDKSRAETNQNICNVIHQHQEDEHQASSTASCTASYAPHTDSLSSVLLKVSDEIYTVGVYIENAAYNPSLSPLLSALDRLRFSESDFGKIKEVVLVEMEGAHVGQEIHTSSIISLIAPEATIKVVKVPAT